MAYIWENYTADKVFVTGKKICPYMEIFYDSINRAEVNPLLRFPELFELLHSEELDATIDNLDACDNILFHYLAQMDKCKGMNYRQRIIESLREEMAAGYFGDMERKRWSELDFYDKDKVLYVLTDRLLCDRNCFFMEAINRLFELSSLCYEEKTDTYYLYLGVLKSAYNLNKFELIKSLFWPVKKKIVPVWTVHYGIIGVTDTMRIDSIQII